MSLFTTPDYDRGQPDPYAVAQRWLGLVAPVLELERASRRGSRYLVLKDINSRLLASPLSLDDVEREMTGLPIAAPLERRVSACILGVPDGL